MSELANTNPVISAGVKPRREEEVVTVVRVLVYRGKRQLVESCLANSYVQGRVEPMGTKLQIEEICRKELTDGT